MDFAGVTLPEFRSALSRMSKVRDVMKPKSAEEIVAEMGKMITASQEKARAAKRVKHG